MNIPMEEVRAKRIPLPGFESALERKNRNTKKSPYCPNCWVLTESDGDGRVSVYSCPECDYIEVYSGVTGERIETRGDGNE